MTLKQYQKFRMILTIIIAMIFSQAIINQNFFLSISIIILALLLHLFIRSRVEEILHDERDWAIGGKAALSAITTYSWIGLVVMLILKSQAILNPVYDIIANTIAFSVCILMLLYAFIYRIHHKGKIFNIYTIFTLIVLVAFVAMAIYGIINGVK